MRFFQGCCLFSYFLSVSKSLLNSIIFEVFFFLIWMIISIGYFASHRNNQINSHADPKSQFIRIAKSRRIAATNLPSHLWARVQKAHFPRLVPHWSFLSPQAWRLDARNTRNYSSQFKNSFSREIFFFSAQITGWFLGGVSITSMSFELHVMVSRT